jgi:alkylation response protein AidB-like acyl-CoA dehydrogenase
VNFDLSDEQQQLRSSVRSVLERECTPALVRSMYEGGQAPQQPWQSAVELGWTALVIPEDCGGLGLGFVELALLMEDHGRALAVGPLLATLSQFVPALLEAGSNEQRRRFLEPVATGALTGTLAIAGESGGFFHPDDALVARVEGSDWILHGRRSYVLDGDRTGEVVAAARVEAGDGIGLFVVPSTKLIPRLPRKSFDASRPLASLEFDAVRVDSSRVLGTPGESADALTRSLHWAQVALALDVVGSAQVLFDRTLEYAKQREQFGRPIGAFQAIQRKFADMFIALEKARATAFFAAMTIAEDDPRRALAASMAKASAGDCQQLVAHECIQIHGGVGYTWEQDVHLYVKRIKSAETLFGTTAVHRQRIATHLGV